MKLWDAPGKMLIRISVVLVIAFFAASPTVRNAALATLLPKTGFSATADLRVLAQAGQPELAQKVAAALPIALEQLASAQGVRIDKPFNVYVFASEQNYTRQGACPPGSRACAFRGNLSLSPLMAKELDTVLPILTHELSHVVLQQRMGMWGASRIPPWFAEGLAVLVSDGGGAEGVDAQEAYKAMVSGQRFTPDLSYSLLSQKTAASFNLPHRLFYRQSALFVRYLKEQQTTEFENLMRYLHAGMGFHKAFEKSFPTPLDVMWANFLKSQGAS